MSLLLRFQGYPPAVIVAVGLHVALIYFLLDKTLTPSDLVNLDEPAYISALTIQENPQRLRRLENERRQAAVEESRRREQEAARQRETERQQAEQARREQAERDQAAREAEQQRVEKERIERERINQERLAEQQRLDEERALAENRAREEELRRTREAEAQRLAQEEASRRAAEQAASDDQTASAYKAAIIQTISENWSIPPSARNGMKVVIQLNLVPTGEVIAVNILESSGDSAFDRSALQAVARADSFPIVQQMPNRVFERGGFRSISLIFRPEDLLR